MKTVFKPDLKSKTCFDNKSYVVLKEKEFYSVDFKFYQKLFVVLILLSTILIFPESPRELAKICEDYNSKTLCNIW